jgi:DNA-binding SARP family transcriptional activator
MPKHEPPRSDETAVEEELFAVKDQLADRIEQLTPRAENHREAAADLLRAAERAEDRARRLSAYRYAIETFAGDRQALDLVDRLSVDWGRGRRAAGHRRP